MSRQQNGAQACDGLGVDDDADTHDKLLHHGRHADVPDILEHDDVGLESLSDFKADILVLAQDGIQRHEHTDKLADDGGQGRAGDFEAREAEMTVDEQVVEHHVDEVCRQVVAHGGLAVAHGAQGVGDGGGDGDGQQADHLDFQV